MADLEYVRIGDQSRSRGDHPAGAMMLIPELQRWSLGWRIGTRSIAAALDRNDGARGRNVVTSRMEE